MNTDSFTDEQLLNLVNNTIETKTDFLVDEITGGYVQATSTHKNKITAYKVTLMFGYDKNKNSRIYQQEISKDTYYIWSKAILLKIESLLICNTGSELNELNALMNTAPKKEKSSRIGNKVEVIGSKVVGKGLTTSSTNRSTNVVLLTESEVSASIVATYLHEKILSEKANFKKPNIDLWVKDIEKAIRIDGRTEQELIGCIDWIYTPDGEFWIPNIMSGKKLRDQFDKMESQMMRSQKKNPQKITDTLYNNGLSAQDLIKKMEQGA